MELQPLQSAEESLLQEGHTVCIVSDKRLAAALMAMGIPLRKDVPSMTIRSADGQLRTTFYFEDKCSEGEFSTGALIAAWSKDLDFIKANPRHPFTYAIAALKNYGNILEGLKKGVRMVRMTLTEGDGTQHSVLVKEGSAKATAAARRGFVRD